MTKTSKDILQARIEKAINREIGTGRPLTMTKAGLVIEKALLSALEDGLLAAPKPATKFMVEIESTLDDVDDVHQLLEICIDAVESDTVLNILQVEESN